MSREAANLKTNENFQWRSFFWADLTAMHQMFTVDALLYRMLQEVSLSGTFIAPFKDSLVSAPWTSLHHVCFSHARFLKFHYFFVLVWNGYITRNLFRKRCRWIFSFFLKHYVYCVSILKARRKTFDFRLSDVEQSFLTKMYGIEWLL